MNRLGCLGPRGTFSEEAAMRYCLNKKRDIIIYKKLEDILYDILKENLMEGIVPVENSIEGGVNCISDLLASLEGFDIKTELVLPIKHYLLGNTQINFKEIIEILSHSQAIAQCHDFINNNFKNIKITECNSTAEAALKVKNSSGEQAAIGSYAACQQYGLEILTEGINDFTDNYTRFWVLGRKDINNDLNEGEKTSIIINLKDKPGALYKVLYYFDAYNINLTRIESRPAKKNLGEYIFFIDFIGSINNENVQKALRNIQKKVLWLKNLGSYQIININW